MARLKYILFLLFLFVVSACGSGKAVPTGAEKYRRAPIKEVTQEQLDEDARLIGALALQESGQHEEALEAYARLAGERPDCAAAWYEMARLTMARGWTDSALACSGRAVALQPGNVWYLLNRAEIFEMRNDGAGMARTLEQVVKLRPDELERYYDLSNAYIAAGNLPAAVEALNRVERKIGVTEPISLQKQRLWEAAGKPDKAQKEIEALAAAMPGEKRYNAILAGTYMKQKKFAKAKACYDRILQADPDDQYIHIQLAEYYKQTGDIAAADREMLLAFENPNLDSSTKLGLLRSFYTAEEFYGPRSATTFRLLEAAMANCPDSAQFAPLCGDVMLRQQRYDQAAEWFEVALRRDSSSYPLWEALLISLSELPEREDDMSRYAQRAEALFPMHTLPHYLQGLHDYQHQRYAEALEHLRAAERWGFNKHYLEAETYRLMAETHYRMGAYDQCWACFEQALRLEPSSVITLNNYAYYLAEQGTQLEKAEQMSRKTLQAEPDNANNLDTYAWILHLMGKEREALPYIERAVGLDKQSTTLREHYNIIKARQ